MLPADGAARRSFVGLAGEAPEDLTVAIPDQINFDGAVGELKAGAPVLLRGFKVGEVTGVDLRFDPRVGTMRTATQIALDPLRFHLRTPVPGMSWSATMNGALKLLVEHHLRAQLSQSPPIVG